jgi:hypothetical protein
MRRLQSSAKRKAYSKQYWGSWELKLTISIRDLQRPDSDDPQARTVAQGSRLAFQSSHGDKFEEGYGCTPTQGRYASEP